MMMLLRLLTIALLGMILAACNLSSVPVTPTEAPTVEVAAACQQIVLDALDNVGPSCDALGRNQACYGYNQVESQFRAGLETAFDAAGDLAQIDSLRLISTAPLDEETGVWGVALMKAQADIPDTLPGQNVTFLLYSGATIDNVSPTMDAIVLSTGISSPACEAAPPSAVLMQSPEGVPVSMSVNGAAVRFGSTLYFTARRNEFMTIAVISGSAEVEAFGVTQLILPGAEVNLPLGAAGGLQVIGPPSVPEPFDQASIQRAPLSLLDLPVQIPPAIPAGPTATDTLPGLPVTATLPPVTVPLPPTTNPTNCIPRTDWVNSYTIRSGDTLFAIAQRYGVSLGELQSGNCISNADLINAGEVLRVPAPPPTAIPSFTPTFTPTATTPATSTPTVADFRADSTVIKAGECTTIRWDVDNIQEVHFEGDPVAGHSSQEVCPQQTTRYTLLVIHPDGNQIPSFLTIEVSTSPDLTA